MMQRRTPEAQGLYRPEFEHDNCGIGFVTHIKGKKSHCIVRKGLEVLENMTHRGAEGADNVTGDGAGILIQVPHDFILAQGIKVPEAGNYGTGLIFLPRDENSRNECKNILNKSIGEAGLELIAYRKVPVNNKVLGEISSSVEPVIEQVFIAGILDQEILERKLYVTRKLAEKYVRESDLVQKDYFYLPSLSSKVLVYKGMLTAAQVSGYFTDLDDDTMTSAISLVHSRFSTNTFPTWDLAQPFRMIAHNGEINTLKGNRFWFEARESLMNSPLLGEDMKKVFPVIEPDKSDSASLDNAFEFLSMAGKSLPHCLAMLIPESWNDKNPISSDLKAFYEYHSIIMEPWDGPASIIFSDGRYIGGILDRNGLRPSRYVMTKDDLMVMGSEVGVQTFPAEDIIEKGRLRPGKILLIDTEEGRVIYDPEIKEKLAGSHPYKSWLENNRLTLEQIVTGIDISASLGAEYTHYVTSFNYTKEDVESLLAPMAVEGKEPTGSMGNDAPLAVLSEKPQRLFSYFKQLFAQVTNPAIDPIREELVMTLTGYLGSLGHNLIDELPDHAKMIKFISPIVTNKQIEVLKNL
ncbi:MAG: glutamate synthase central domain-containing protein, partial [bacterium]